MIRFLGLVLLGALSWYGLWRTPQQQGQAAVDRGDFEEAANLFVEPEYQGAAWYRAGEFENAAKAFAEVDTPEGYFNRGNSLMLLGQYEEAVRQYDIALERRPDWEPAQVNREIAAIRAERTKRTGGDMGDQQLGADEIVFDPDKKPGGQDTQVEQESGASDNMMQSVWLRKVQTRPADFLRAKFAYQAAYAQDKDGAGESATTEGSQP